MWWSANAAALCIIVFSCHEVLAEETTGQNEFIGPIAANVAGALTGAAHGLATGGIAGGVIGGLAGGLLGGNFAQTQRASSPPQLAVKLMPSKHMKIAKRDLQSIIGDLRHEIRKQVYNVERQYMNTAKPEPRALLYSPESFLPGPEAARFLEVQPRKESPPSHPMTKPTFRQTDRVRPCQQQRGDREVRIGDIVEALNELSDIAETDHTPQSPAKKDLVLTNGPL